MAVTICAEVGINHMGNPNLAHELIRQAAIAGADLVKFQLYDPEVLFANEPELIPEAMKCQIDHQFFNRLVRWCDDEGIEPFFSVFDRERLTWCESIGIRQYKLASRTIARDLEFAIEVARRGKTTYAAMGMGTISEAQIAFASYANVRLLYCVAKYPAEYADYSEQLGYYRDSRYFGISDHTMGIGVALGAIGRGAGYVEKHFTLDKTLPGSDHLASITPDELMALVRYGREIARAFWSESRAAD